MAIQRGPWTWGARKTAGDMTMLRLKGQQIARGRRAKGQSNPSPQFLQAQATSGGIWELRRQAAGMIALGFTLGLEKQGRPQRFYKYTWDHALSNTTPPAAKIINYDETLLLSRGNMAITPMLTTTFSEATQTLALTWDDEILSYGKNPADKLMFFIKNRDTGLTYSITQVTDRGLGAASVTFPGTFAAETDTLLLYTAFIQTVDDMGPVVPGAGLSSNSVFQEVVAGA